MKRTRWPDVNNIKNLYYDNISISCVNKKIDRIQLSIKYSSSDFQYIKKIFDADLKEDKKETKRKYTRNQQSIKYIYNYHIDDNEKIQLIKYIPNYSRYFSLSLQEPSEDLQKYICKILNIIPRHNIFVSQIEVCWDIYPADASKLNLLQFAINNSIFLRYSRVGSTYHYKNYETNSKTHYQGKNGNVREGSKGSRIYLKPYSDDGKIEPEYCRIELQVNRPLIKGKNITIKDFPVDSNLFPFHKYFDFRQNMTKDDVTFLRNCIVKKKYKKWHGLKDPTTRVKISSLHYAIREKLCDSSSPFSSLEYDSIPVADQIGNYKELKDKYKLMYNIDKFFPKKSVGLDFDS